MHMMYDITPPSTQYPRSLSSLHVVVFNRARIILGLEGSMIRWHSVVGCRSWL